MPGPWFTAQDLLAAISDVMSSQVLAAKWAGIASRCADKAYADISNILEGRGYTSAQLDAWDDRVVYSRDQALFWAHVEGTIFTQNPDVATKLDRRKELAESFGLRINGVVVAPGATDPAVGVAAGSLTQIDSGVNYGTTFGLRRNRVNGQNQYGDPLYPGDAPTPAGW